MTSSRPPSYRRGDHGPAVIDIRVKLAGVGLLERPDVLGDAGLALFDDECDLAVRRFQQQRGITVDGVVGPLTYRTLDEACWTLGDRVLSYAPGRLMRGDDVAALQGRLLSMGFDCARVDGVFGVETDAALRDFQRNVGLVADGICGPDTLESLERLARTISGGAPQGLRESVAIARSGPTLAGKVMVIDPGHGGQDRGAVAHDLDETELVEDLAARVEGRLLALGVIAYLTRPVSGPGTGTPPELDQDETRHHRTMASEEARAAFAN
ncbi:MAG: N-acetylmuramoyl-L-alanine amidase, partial [Actinomycetes bacterium]